MPPYAELEVGAVYRSRFGRTVLEADNVWFTLLPARRGRDRVRAVDHAAAVILETERLVLRKPRADDADALFVLHSDPEAMRFVGGVRPEPADTVETIRHWLELWDRNGVGHFVAERRDDGAVLGRVGFVVWDTSIWEIRTKQDAGEHAQPELGWALAREHWGSGYATEGAGAARDWFRREHRDARLISVIAPENERSTRVAERLGCTPAETIELAQHGPALVWEHP